MVYPMKKDEERVRRPDPVSGKARHGELRPTKAPNVKSDWHPNAKAWFKSLKNSGQSDYFQDSDWAMAVLCADYLTKWYEKPRAMDMQNILTMMAKLGTTEADRRQLLRIELEMPAEDEKPAALVAIEGYKKDLGIG